MFVKVCGLTEPGHVLWAAELGFDAVGVVLHRYSPRYCTPGTAAELANLARESGITTVAVGLVHEEVAPLRGIFDYVQVYSWVPESRLILAGAEAPAEEADYEYFLYDASRGSGTRKHFPPWLSAYRDRLILSGGLDPGNVHAAIAGISPFGVDVSSGVEEARGKKSYRLMKEFLREARREIE